MMPPASAVAAISGILLMFWRRVAGFFRTILHAITRTFSGKTAR
jgi:hypothetical protein